MKTSPFVLTQNSSGRHRTEKENKRHTHTHTHKPREELPETGIEQSYYMFRVETTKKEKREATL